MYKHQIIRKTVAALMLVVFAISVTPNIVFHNWFADHTDTYSKKAGTKGSQLGKQTFNCHCDNIVAESPFTETSAAIINYPSQPLSSARVDLQVHFNSSKQFLYSLRGPPTV